ncbi:MAG: hypothetical protein QOD06_1308, partial [Candidatus Binatota bacterium]|nr:hypothetical protein [Candidatus Binatota bacterium]
VDTYGHLVGARTIGYLGRLIGRFARPGDVVARFGGDEFVLILPATPTAAAAELAEKIREAIARAVRLEDEDVDISGITASVGVATFPDHAQDAESLFRAADGCMYAIKRLGKNAVAVAGDASVAHVDKAE